MNTNDIENRIKFLSENDNINWTQQGWQCPVCKAVMSPTTSVCVNCRGIQGGGIATTQPSLDKYIHPTYATQLQRSWGQTGDYPNAVFDMGVNNGKVE
jgi:hypothetical protein